jgi:hypothetical protein
VQVLQQRCCAFVSFSAALVGWLAPDVRFDLIGLGNALQCLLGHRPRGALLSNARTR